MSLDQESPDTKVPLPELRRDSPDADAVPDADGSPPRKSGLVFAFGMIMLLTLLVYLNMG